MSASRSGLGQGSEMRVAAGRQGRGRRGRRRGLIAAALALAALVGCNEDNTVTVPPRPAVQPVPFSAVVDQLFSNSANSMPVPIDNLDVVYDVNEDPSAFDALILSGAY